MLQRYRDENILSKKMIGYLVLTTSSANLSLSSSSEGIGVVGVIACKLSPPPALSATQQVISGGSSAPERQPHHPLRLRPPLLGLRQYVSLDNKYHYYYCYQYFFIIIININIINIIIIIIIDNIATSNITFLSGLINVIINSLSLMILSNNIIYNYF